MKSTAPRRWMAAAVCLLLSCVPARAAEFQRLEDVLRHAYATNPKMLALREDLLGAHELVPQAQAGWKPTVDAGANVTRAWLDGDNFGGGGSTSKGVNLGVTENLYRGGRTVASSGSARNTVMARGALLSDSEQQFMLDVATAYMDVLRDTALIRLAEHYQTLVTGQLDAARARFDAGDATRTDVAQAESRLAGAEARLVSARGDLRGDSAAFSSLTGLAPASMGYPVLSFPFPETRDGAVARAQEDNPAVRASRYLHEASQSDIDSVFGELLPRLYVSGSIDRQYDPQPGLVDRSTEKTLALVASIPLYEGGATRSRVRQAKYEAARRSFNILSAGRDAERQTISAWESLAVARSDIAARQRQVSAAAEARDGVHNEAKMGTRTVLDELDADLEYLDARTALVSARRDEIVAQFALARAMGMLTPTMLGFGGLAADYDVHLNAAENKILGMDVELGNAAY